MDNIIFVPGFLSTLSLRRATVLAWCSSGGAFDFYPRSPCGERRFVTAFRGGVDNFYPRSPCGERRVTVLGIQHRTGISIHALLAESDASRAKTIAAKVGISIHALLAESDASQGA